jgi:peptide/nickel transport system ATP-binding protein
MNRNAPLLEVKNLRKSFYSHSLVPGKRKEIQAVRGVSFEIERNTVFGLVGESGSGKTTLARAVLYLDPPGSGTVLFDGTDLGTLRPGELRGFRRRMQIVFQDPNSALNPMISVRRSLEEGLENLGFGRAERERRIAELAEMVSIPVARLSDHPHEFSGGQRQRIVIARALSMEPEFLVLDEPVSNLDVSIQAQITNLLLDLRERLSLTYLFISHDLNLVSYVSDVIAVMYRGRIVELGPTEEVTRHPVHPYTRHLFDSAPGGEPVPKAESPNEEGTGGPKTEVSRVGPNVRIDPHHGRPRPAGVIVRSGGMDADEEHDSTMVEVAEGHFVLRDEPR